MLAICEECSKKYNIDESKMKGPRARFSCRECGHIIVVVKSDAPAAAADKQQQPEEKNSSGQ
ncbi:zinc-ribbon domain-containing protein [Desulfobulbus propionicus]|jgi:DNA-directed RNA polymerase subunit RPC12/RpoP